jgi:hypothetical protein
MGERTNGLVRSAATLKRRGILAGVSALVATVVAKAGSPRRADAAHAVPEDVIHSDQVNTTGDTTAVTTAFLGTPTMSFRNASNTLIARADGAQGSSGFMNLFDSGLRGHHDRSGIGVTGQAATNTGCGVYGHVPGTPTLAPPSGTGVFGKGPTTGVHGQSDSGVGAIGSSGSNIGV